tara:strand:+ start:43014 stop:43184 length:171 start_codon:yes stop_codon:yes gene_type:complete
MNTEQKLEKETISYIIKTILNKTDNVTSFKMMYDYVTDLMEREKVYSLSTTIRTCE